MLSGTFLSLRQECLLTFLSDPQTSQTYKKSFFLNVFHLSHLVTDTTS